MSQRRILVAAILAVPFALAPAAGARVVHVHHGQSIQGAIDRAHAGDTIVVGRGVFHENLTITKSHITLRGAGDTRGGTVLVRPRHPHPSICSEHGDVNGICVTGRFVPNSTIIGKPIVATQVNGFLVRGFSRFGILLNNAVDTGISGNTVTRTAGYGIVGFYLRRIALIDNVSQHNRQAGFHIGDSPRAHARLIGNKALHNRGPGGMGMFLRDTSFGLVRGNLVQGNCVGILLVDTGQPGPVRDWTVTGNRVRANTAACPPAEEGGPPQSGYGIGLLGTRHAVVSNNIVTGNHPTERTPLVGGIFLLSAKSVGGANPRGNLIRNNHVRNNRPADVIYDGSGRANRFAANRCGKSIPASICR